MAEQYALHHKKVSDLIEYVNNSRTHSDEQVNQVASSIKEFGFTTPILIDEQNGIIAGHGRLMAAKKLGLEEVPCIVLAGLTEAQKKAYVIADNKLALNSGWDDAMLKLEIANLDELGFDLDLLGFDTIELGSLFDDDAVDSADDDLKDHEYHEVFNVVVQCRDEEEQEKIFNRLDAEGYSCQVQSL